ncbi:META domain-containing protein [Streptomyces chiangmaiensis]|uniref:META domain-containing protein n=1 Tax=Streptomyces chiangmaiensis TaxID=766497 RepID=A0ABU7FSH4_9ACTN|nr:META domain-containing protein [Streptomyces chiangmaiensis]MED7827060.1 META domain-containing protein [Streptomyces chiangmaiensis]
MDKHRLTLTVLTLLPLAVACGTETGRGSGSGSVGSDSSSQVTGVHWRVDSLTVNGTTRNAPAGAYLHIDDRGRAQGNYGCNSFGASATVRADRIDLGPAQSTEMACEKAPMAFEASFSRTLAGGSLTVAVDRSRLTLTGTGGDRVHLTKENDASLYGTKWHVESLVDGDVSSSLPVAATGKAWFTLDRTTGTASGSLGCNRFTVRATVRDGQLTLSAPRATRMMCDGSLMDAERTMNTLFGRTLSYRLGHRDMTLTSENGKGVSAVAEP